VILAVDGGNSKTDLALVATDGRLLAALRGPTTSHQQIGFQPGIERLAGLVAELRQLAGIRLDAPAAEVGAYGLAGADTPADTRRLTEALAARGLADDGFVVNDAFTPIRAGSDRGWGVALICGQGVNAAGIAPDGRTARLAALGDISGDWGGGHDIGTAALGAAVRARDGRGPRTVLESFVPAHFGLARPIDVTRRIEAGTLAHRRLAELSPLVFAAAGSGDAVARSILDRQGDELVAMARAIIGRLHLTRLDPTVVLAGGVFNARDEVLERRVEAGIRSAAPDATIRRSEALPVVGAALLGLDRALGTGGPGHAAAVDRLRASLGTWRPAGGDPPPR
jgi:N-acetylglucosamine kinase-like BadF-type ATPase